jgi:ubiquinone biosynthesis monooxygenase Coq7
MFDDLVIGFDRALRTLAGRPATVRPIPGAQLPDTDMPRSERLHAAGLMRVNHTG